MTGVGTLTLVGLVVLAVLIVVFLKVRQKDLLGAMMQKRQATSKIVSRADYVEGMQTIPVALALSADTIYYENPDLEASFELARIDEVEYSDELATGKTVPDDCSVLRLRSHGAAFEFVMPRAECKKWMSALPPRTTDNRPSAHAV
jgi:hypothetical protein